MEVQAWDEVFIRCRRSTVNGLVVHVPTWQRWWPGLSSTPIAADRTALTFATPWRLPRRHALVVTVDRVRPRDKGLEFSVAGDVLGTGEWYHLDRPDGVVVHYLLRGEMQGELARPGPARRWLAAHRASVRAALTGMKARLEGGRIPGAEPDPALRAHQAEELAIFATEVTRHRDEVARREASGPAGGRTGDAEGGPGSGEVTRHRDEVARREASGPAGGS